LNLLFFHLLQGNIKIIIYQNIILPIVLYGCGTSYLTLKAEHRLRKYDDRVLSTTLELREIERQEDRENCIMRSSIMCRILFTTYSG
jgi:hypothetical protein